MINAEGMYVNGITRVIMEYYTHMPEVQFDFISASSVDSGVETELQKRNSKIYVLNRKRNPLGYMFQVKKVCKENSYNIVHVHGNSATMFFDLLPARLAGVKKRIAHSHSSTCEHKIMHSLLKQLFKKQYTDALSCSDTAGKWIFGKGNFRILNNAISLKKYVYCPEIRGEYRKRFGIAESQIVLGHVGLCKVPKNKKYLLGIVKDLIKEIDAVLFLVGNGDRKIIEELESKIREYGLEKKVFLLGGRDDIPQMLMMMDIFLFPSLWEGFPIAVIEAQASGLPCIASEYVPKAADLAGNVKYISLKEKEKWIAEIKGLVNCGFGNRKEVSADNISKIREKGFDIEKEAGKLEKVYAAVLQERNHHD